MNFAQARAQMKLRLVPAPAAAPVQVNTVAAAPAPTRPAPIEAPSTQNPLEAVVEGAIDNSWCDYAGDLAADGVSLAVIADNSKPSKLAPQGYFCENVEEKHLDRVSRATARLLRKRWGDGPMPEWADLALAIGNMYMTVRRNREPLPPRPGQAADGTLVPDMPARPTSSTPPPAPAKKPDPIESLFPPAKDLPPQGTS